MSGLKTGLVLLAGLVFWIASAPGHLTASASPAPAAPPPAAPAHARPAPPTVPAGPGTVWSEGELQAALQAQGLAPARAHVGAAIAEAESGGRADAVHLCPPRCDAGQAPERSWGPWQLNLIAHPWVTPACAMALACAAHAAAVISGSGADWRPWSTYTTGAYLRWM